MLRISLVVVLGFYLAEAQLPPYLNCTRYLDPCVARKGASCCGYPFYDCISDGRQALCQSITDFPEIGAEVLLRLREARDRGDPEAYQIQNDLYDLAGPTTKRGNRATTQRSRQAGGRRPAGSGGRQPAGRSTARTTRRPTTRRPNRQTTRRNDDA